MSSEKLGDALARKQIKDFWGLLKRDTAEAREDAGRVFHWLRRLPKACVCLTGWHRWSEWGPSSSVFSPPESRYCKRCSGREYRGEAPTFTMKVEAGSWSET